MDFEVIMDTIKEILNESKTARLCCSCPGSCSDPVRFICMGYTIKDIVKYVNEHQQEELI